MFPTLLREGHPRAEDGDVAAAVLSAANRPAKGKNTQPTASQTLAKKERLAESSVRVSQEAYRRSSAPASAVSSTPPLDG